MLYDTVINITKPNDNAYIIAVFLFLIRCATKFLTTNYFNTLSYQNKHTNVTNLSTRCYTFKLSNTKPNNKPINIQKNIPSNRLKLNDKSASGNR